MGEKVRIEYTDETGKDQLLLKSNSAHVREFVQYIPFVLEKRNEKYQHLTVNVAEFKSVLEAKLPKIFDEMDDIDRHLAEIIYSEVSFVVEKLRKIAMKQSLIGLSIYTFAGDTLNDRCV